MVSTKDQEISREDDPSPLCICSTTLIQLLLTCQEPMFRGYTINNVFDVMNLHLMGARQTINKKSSGLQSVEIFQKEGTVF